MTRNRVRLTGLLVLSITFGVVGTSASNAAPTLASTPSTSSFSPFPKGTIKPQSIATDPGGAFDPAPKSVREILEEISAAARSAGGWSILAKTVQVIYQTVRICPECLAS